MEVEHWNENWGVLNEQNMKKKLENDGFSVVTYTYLPGTYFPEHSHSIDKKDTVISGQFRMTAAGKEFILGPGDMLLVPANTVHTAEVVGKTPVVSLDATKK
jgi:quercetin dioxygenase-like cupin family protein